MGMLVDGYYNIFAIIDQSEENVFVRSFHFSMNIILKISYKYQANIKINTL